MKNNEPVLTGWMLFWDLVFEADKQLTRQEQQAKEASNAQKDKEDLTNAQQSQSD